MDFRNTVIIMTSNIGSMHILEWAGGRSGEEAEGRTGEDSERRGGGGAEARRGEEGAVTAIGVSAVTASAAKQSQWDRVADKVRGELRLHFRPEFLNRVDDIVVFRPLSREDIGKIVELQPVRLTKLLADRHVGLEVTGEAKALLAEWGYDPVYGARPLKRVIQNKLQNPIALEVLEGKFPEGSTISVVASGGQLKFTP